MKFLLSFSFAKVRNIFVTRTIKSSEQTFFNLFNKNKNILFLKKVFFYFSLLVCLKKNCRKFFILKKCKFSIFIIVQFFLFQKVDTL